MNSDLSDLLRLFDECGVRFLVVGGYAVMKYTEPYSTKDLDLWIEATRENAQRALDALRRFGAPVTDLTTDDLVDPDAVLQIGVEPNRVDILSAVSGLEFANAWERRVIVNFGNGVNAPVLSLDDIIAAKEAAGRPKDRLQARQLKKARAKYHDKK